MTAAHSRLSGVLLAVTLVAASISGCSPGPERPKPIPYDKPLPTCIDFLPVLISLGMDHPEIEPPSRSDLPPTEVNCPFLGREVHAPGMTWARVIAVRPDKEPYEGVPLERWGEIFVTSYRCEGIERSTPTMPRGTFCYWNDDDTGRANLLGFPNSRGIWVSVHWWDPDATAPDLRTAAEQKADELARQVTAML